MTAKINSTVKIRRLVAALSTLHSVPVRDHVKPAFEAAGLATGREERFIAYKLLYIDAHASLTLDSLAVSDRLRGCSFCSSHQIQVEVD